MQVILLENIKNLGSVGESVQVRAGYARNFLFRLNKAIRATKTNLEDLAEQKSYLQRAYQDKKNLAIKNYNILNKKHIIIICQATEQGKLYGAVNKNTIIKEIKNLGVLTSELQIESTNTIKSVGIFDIIVKLHIEVIVNIKLIIASSKEEAKEMVKAKIHK